MPMVRWYDEFGNLIISGTTLTRENVQLTGRNPTFICIVSSDAGSVQEVVKLTVYGKLEYKFCDLIGWNQVSKALNLESLQLRILTT